MMQLDITIVTRVDVVTTELILSRSEQYITFVLHQWPVEL